MRRLALAIAALGTLALGTQATLAQDNYPSRPIHIVVPYPAGGTTDQMARAIQQVMSDKLGQPIVIENRAGAGGTIGTNQVARANPDGYTLVFGNSGPNAIAPLIREVPYDPLKDLMPISTVAFTPMILAVPADSPIKDVKSFVDWAKREPGKINYASVGNGSLSHLTGELFRNLAGVDMVHVPYNGGAPMLTALAGSQVHAAFVTGLDGAAMQQGGRIRYIAISTQQPTDVAAGMATVAATVPGFHSTSWFGLLAPKGTPEPIIKKLHEAVTAAVTPELRKTFAARNVEARTMTPQEMGKMIADEMKQWGDVVKKANIKM